jgi:hypothetical protein
VTQRADKPKKHHYLPAFYLKRWTSEDGLLIEYSRPWKNELRDKRVHPNATGYVKGLYELRDLPPETAQQAEELFFKPADTHAADALDLLYENSMPTWQTRERSGWSRFLVSLLLRTPEEIPRVKAALAAVLDRETLVDDPFLDRARH